MRPAFQCLAVMDVTCHSEENLAPLTQFLQNVLGNKYAFWVYREQVETASFQLCNVLGWDWHPGRGNIAKSVLFHSRTQ